MTISPFERDMEKYALEKVTNLIKDVVQGFNIGGMHRAEALPLLGAMFMRLSASIAVALHMPRDAYVERASNMFDQQVNLNERIDHGEKKQAQAAGD